MSEAPESQPLAAESGPPSRGPGVLRRPRVAWVGPTDTAEFAPAFGRTGRMADVAVHGDVTSLLGDADRGEADLLVLACERPVATPSEYQRAVASFGAERSVQLLGAWCEGEGRTGHPLPGVERVFWHGWSPWSTRWLNALSLDEAVGADRTAIALSERAGGFVVIDTIDCELAAALSESLAEAGYGVVWTRAAGTKSSLAAIRNPAAVVWDASQLSGREADRLFHLARAYWAPIVALVDFPRVETVAAAHAIGARRVLAKPFTADDLRDAVAKCLQVTAERSCGGPEAQALNAELRTLGSNLPGRLPLAA